MSRPRLLDVVRLTTPLPEIGLQGGERGTIVDEYRSPREAYEVEFIGNTGATIEVYSLTPDQFEVLSPWKAPVPQEIT